MSDKPRGFVFYTQDYFGDAAVRLMPLDLRMVWVETFFLMDQSPQRGILLKKNGSPYEYAELASLIRCTEQTIKSALEWVLREGIADSDPRTGAITCRRMVREEKRRKIGQKFGKKGGGNPVLASAVNTRNEKVYSAPIKVNPKVGVYTTDPDPDPDPDTNTEKVLSDYSLPVGMKNEPTGRKRDLAMDYFCERCQFLTGTPYVIRKQDAVRLNELRKAYKTPNRQKPPDWDIAVENYFASPLPQYALADLANPSRYAVFHNSALDGYKTPINHDNAKGRNNGRQPGESEQQAKIRRNIEAAQQFKNRTDSQTGDPVRSRIATVTDGDFSGVFQPTRIVGTENSRGSNDSGVVQTGDAAPRIHPATHSKR